MKLKCLNCGNEFEGSVSLDELGWHSYCEECDQSFDVDIGVSDDMENIKELIRKFETVGTPASEMSETEINNFLKLFDLYFAKAVLEDFSLNRARKIAQIILLMED